MTTPTSKWKYYDENALNLFHLFVKELNSKIIDECLNLCGLHLKITRNRYKEEAFDRRA